LSETETPSKKYLLSLLCSIHQLSSSPADTSLANPNSAASTSLLGDLNLKDSLILKPISTALGFELRRFHPLVLSRSLYLQSLKDGAKSQRAREGSQDSKMRESFIAPVSHKIIEKKGLNKKSNIEYLSELS
jgi:hypothetical protein